jgi:hypothetical protein
MKFFNKILLASTFVSSISIAAQYGDNIYYVDDFYTSAEGVKNTLSQVATGANNSCGLTSLLFINNYYSERKVGISAPFTSNVLEAQSALSRLYSYLGQSYNTTTHFDNIKNIPKYKWQWENTRRASSSNSLDTNIELALNNLKNDIPMLIALKGTYSGNPVYQSGYDYKHIVIFYAYQRKQDPNGHIVTDPNNSHENDLIYYYDPYFGGNGYFKRSEISQAVDLVNFAYLKPAE